MIRLMLLLCAALFGAMLIMGEDHGQKRFGLRPENALPSLETSVAATETQTTSAPAMIKPAPRPIALTEATFVPEAPLMATPVITAQDMTAAEPASGKVMYVAARSLNVREGPGTDTNVLERLDRDEAVTVVVEGDGPDGWSLIRIEGDGVEGYVAARLLRE